MSDWIELYITDKTGAKHFKTMASPLSANSERKNLSRHIEQAKKYPDHYKFLDIESAILMFDGQPYIEMTVDEILAQLNAPQ